MINPPKASPDRLVLQRIHEGFHAPKPLDQTVLRLVARNFEPLRDVVLTISQGCGDIRQRDFELLDWIEKRHAGPCVAVGIGAPD